MSKKLDSYHFIEIFRDSDTFLVKDQNGSFRKGEDNKPKYQELFYDGLNVTSWLTEQLALKSEWYKKSSKMFFLKNAEINQDAPLIKKLLTNFPQFSTIKSSQLSGVIKIDEKTALPVSLKLKMNLSSKNQYWIKIDAKMTLDLDAKNLDLSVPKVNDDKPASFPVNVSEKFNQLIKEQTR